MARIAYADTGAESVRPLTEKIRAQRGEILHLYRMLLHAPAVADGWLGYFTAVRQRCALAGNLRELVIMRIAQLNGARYEAEQHKAYALREGVSQVQLDALEKWQTAAAFTGIERAVLAYTDAMTRGVKVPDEVFAEVQGHFDERGIVELTALVAGYNMVSRFLVALDIQGEDEV